LALLGDSGISQRELARRLGVSPSRINQILAGQNMTLRTLADLGWALGLRLTVVGLPFEDRTGTPATTDAEPPEWLTSLRTRVAKTSHAR
jgi:transcriptional regulator with XRE-family HTH domain